MAARAAEGGAPTQSPTPTPPPPTPPRKGRDGPAATRDVSRMVDPYRRQFVVAASVASEHASFLIIEEIEDEILGIYDQLRYLFEACQSST